MSHLAVDTVLVPPPSLLAQAHQLNVDLLRTNPPAIVLGTVSIAHISLSMGVIEQAMIKNYEAELNHIARQTKPLTLRTAGIDYKVVENGVYLSSIQIELTQPLVDLHRAIMALNDEYFGTPVEREMIHTPNEVEDITLSFIDGFVKNSAWDRYSPHITLGMGKMEDRSFVHEFTADTLALYHVGNYCTCRTELARAVIIGDVLS